MSFGIEVFNDFGITLIDQDFSNYATYSSGTLSSLGVFYDVMSTPFYYFEIFIPAITGSILFLRPSTLPGDFFLVSGGGAGEVARIGSSTSSPIKFKILSPSSGFSIPATYGLNIFKPDGALAFSSDYEYMVLSSTVSAVVNADTTVSIFGSLKERYISINPAARSGWVNGTDETGFHYLGDLYYIVYMATNESWDLYLNWYSYFYGQFSGGSMTGGLIGMNDTRQFLVMET